MDRLAQYERANQKLAAVALYPHLGGWEGLKEKGGDRKILFDSSLRCGLPLGKGCSKAQPPFLSSGHLWRTAPASQHIWDLMRPLLGLHHNSASPSAPSRSHHILIDIIPKRTSQESPVHLASQETQLATINKKNQCNKSGVILHLQILWEVGKNVTSA